MAIDASRSATPDGAYYKDLNNEFNKFEGVWKSTDGNSELTIVLQKVEQLQVRNDYRDYLIGEYKYIENEMELINTIPPIQDINTETHNIGGGYIINSNVSIPCDDCTPNERRLDLYISDPERDYLSASIVLRYLEGSNPEQMTATIISDGGGMIPNENSPTELRVPYGEYLMVKQ
ncbi:hypothetical protein ES676_14430 [Bizionia saleffrena]|uniref:DUF6705 domain-containing protein n=1 Tax=Bizionia saleffrena TaxID=291189 RepID=A0A8H2LCM4_9FLAO|nr:hypothetical protein ES676_14430 [Bizionia saleffrena]